ncbi:MAG: hypothetical protein KDA78_11940, partial [Planctomycetaceae bacterium]|nr:hypothetical protein [Planctomycetaceae bacterium]
VRHQTGSSQATDHLRALYALTEIEADVRDFFTKPQEMYQDVDTAVTRAGGTTLAELEMLDIQAVVVPMSQSADNHQMANARSYAAISGQLLIVQENQPDTFHKFTAALNRLLSIPSNHKRSSEAPQLDAVEKICDLMANTIQTDHSHR